VRSVLLTVAGVASFAALLAWMTFRQVSVDCEVCVSWKGGQHCAQVSAGTADEALRQGVNTACGVLTAGMADELECQRAAPHRSRCAP